MDGKGGTWWAIGVMLLLVFGSYGYSFSIAMTQQGRGERLAALEASSTRIEAWMARIEAKLDKLTEERRAR